MTRPDHHAPTRLRARDQLDGARTPLAPLVRSVALVLAVVAAAAAVAWLATAPARSDALCDAMKARFGPGYPCLNVPTNTFTPTAPTAPTTPGSTGQNGGGPQAGSNIGPGPGEGNGTPIVPVPGQGQQTPTTAPVPNTGATPTQAVPSPATSPTVPSRPSATPAPSSTPSPAPTSSAVPQDETDRPAPAPTQSASTGSDTTGTGTQTALWLLAGAAALVAGASSTRTRAGGYRGLAAANGYPSAGAALRSWLPRGGSERATIGSSQLVLINDATSPREYVFHENVPPGGHIAVNPDGTATIYDRDGRAVSTIAKPWAYDALGRPQRTWYTVGDNGDLVQHVDASDDALYPILADPNEDGTALGGQALGQASGRSEGSSWDTPLPDGGKVVNTIPQGNGDQTVDQVFYDAQGNQTSTARVTSNGEGGYQRWGDNSDGSSGYQAQDAPNADVYGGSWDAGNDPATQSPDSVYGQNWQATQSQTVRSNSDGTQTTVTSTQDNTGQWNHTTELSDGSTIATTSGPGGENTTVTGQLDSTGSGWVTDAYGNRADRYLDGNGNPVTVTTDPDSGAKTYYFVQDGQQRANTYDKYGNNTGSKAFNPDGTVQSGWETSNDGTRSITYNPDGSLDVTDHSNDVDWYKIHYNPDGSGTQYLGDFSRVDFAADGTITDTHPAPDTRSLFEKTGDAAVDYYAGVGRAALDSGKDLGTLTGTNFWDGPDKGQATREAWTGVGKSAEAAALYAAKLGDFANSGNVPGLPQKGEAGTILRGIRDSFIARDDFARGNTAYGAGKVSFNVISAIVGTKGAGAAAEGADAAAGVARGAVRGAEIADGPLPTIELKGGLPPEHLVPEVNPSIPKSILPDDYKPFGDLHPYEYGNRYRGEDGWIFPKVPRNGFAQKPGGAPGEPWIIDPDYQPPAGTAIDRIGHEYGNYFAPSGTPFAERALPPDSMGKQYREFLVTGNPLPEGWRIELGPAQPWFEKPGMGMQLHFVKPPKFKDPVVDFLINEGYLREVTGK